MSVALSHAQQLAEIRNRILNLLLNDGDLVDTLLERPIKETPAEEQAHRDQIEEIHTYIPLLHAADLADLLEALPEDERLALWHPG